ncbi:hypothetical protein, partial [Pseudomonas viridiflava]|uniref:hypothetical protein n=1 Tax=Pseudomonas viridiflava TaxID=33069 RepID=UPI00197E4F8B
VSTGSSVILPTGHLTRETKSFHRNDYIQSASSRSFQGLDQASIFQRPSTVAISLQLKSLKLSFSDLNHDLKQ